MPKHTTQPKKKRTVEAVLITRKKFENPKLLPKWVRDLIMDYKSFKEKPVIVEPWRKGTYIVFGTITIELGDWVTYKDGQAWTYLVKDEKGNIFTMEKDKFEKEFKQVKK